MVPSTIEILKCNWTEKNKRKNEITQNKKVKHIIKQNITQNDILKKNGCPADNGN